MRNRNDVRTFVTLESGSREGNAIPAALVECHREWATPADPETAFTVELHHHGDAVSVAVVSPDGRTVSKTEIPIDDPIRHDRERNRARAAGASS